MEQAIDSLPFGIVDIGATGVVILTVIMVFTGRLVPKRYYDEAITRLHEQQEVNRQQREINSGLVELNRSLVSKDDLASKAIEAMRENAAWQRHIVGRDRSGAAAPSGTEETG